MANYRISFTVNGNNIKAMQRKVSDCFGSFADEQIAAKVAKIDPSRSRADRLADIASTVQDCCGDIEELKDELQDWHDNLPESFQNGDKGSELNDSIQELEQLKDELEGLDFTSINFPAMY